jgi:hypothetical protein
MGKQPFTIPISTSSNWTASITAEFRATTANFSPAILELDAAMRAGRLEHDGSPVLEWCIGNVVGKADRRGNLYPTKARPEQKIDAAGGPVGGTGRPVVGTVIPFTIHQLPTFGGERGQRQERFARELSVRQERRRLRYRQFSTTNLSPVHGAQLGRSSCRMS